ncbi:PAS domain-containing protein [Pelagibius marinus]|uniref:PAS domain-containing protein n=1 Tax=Pelagibius marinus TaxID=2762760 RepID=UPI001872AF00|nr:PAS domain-containing protein [Pelagibius marinus]
MSDQDPSADDSGHQTTKVSDLVEQPQLRRLFDYWCAKRHGAPIPKKNDIDPIDISWALSRIFLVDYIPGEGFVYRLAGNEIARVFGRANLKGLNLRDFVKPERLVIVERAWRRAIEQQCVISMKGMVYYGADRTGHGGRLILPLSGDSGKEATSLLGMTVCEWEHSDTPAKMRQPDVYFLPVTDIP